MVVAFEHLHVEVTDGIVAFVVDDIHQRSNLRELVGHELQDFLHLAAVVVVRHLALQHHHQFARRRGTDHDVTQQAFLRAQVEEREIVGVGIVAHRVANLVGDVVLQPAFVDGQYLVECSRNVESHRVHLVVLHVLLHLLFGEPAFVGERKLQLVAVEARFFRAQNGTKFRKFYLPDAGEVVEYLFLLVLELLFVRQTLPFASSAHAEMAAERLHTQGRFFIELYGHRFGVMVLLAFHLQIDYIARHYIRDKYYQFIHFSHGFAFCGYVCYCHFLQ